MELKREDILALTTEKKELVCNKCATDQDWAAVTGKSMLFMPETLKDSKSLFFCDRCSTRIGAGKA